MPRFGIWTLADTALVGSQLPLTCTRPWFPLGGSDAADHVAARLPGHSLVWRSHGGGEALRAVACHPVLVGEQNFHSRSYPVSGAHEADGPARYVRELLQRNKRQVRQCNTKSRLRVHRGEGCHPAGHAARSRHSHGVKCSRPPTRECNMHVILPGDVNARASAPTYVGYVTAAAASPEWWWKRTKGWWGEELLEEHTLDPKKNASADAPCVLTCHVGSVVSWQQPMWKHTLQRETGGWRTVSLQQTLETGLAELGWFKEWAGF